MVNVDNNANRTFTIVNVYIRVYFYRQSEQEKNCTKGKNYEVFVLVGCVVYDKLGIGLGPPPYHGILS